jgi:hypothetical protein
MLGVGCNEDPTGNSTGRSSSSRLSTSKTTPVAVTMLNSALPEARTEAEAFLKTLCSGDAAAASAKVSANFKKQHFPPFYDNEQKLGYSESDAQKKLQAITKGLQASAIRTELLAPSGKEASFRGDLSGGKDKASFSIRVTKADSGWQVTRFFVGKVAASAVAKSDGNAELAWIQETALDFLEALLGDDDEQNMTMSEMTTEFKKRLPSPSIADAGLGYAKKDVRQWLNDQRKGATGFTITQVELDPKGRKFTGELTGGAAPKGFTLWVVNADGGWMVNDFAGR